MNVTELARRLRVHPKKMLEILPKYGFDIGAKAIKVDDRIAQQIMRQWRRIKRDMEEARRKELEEQKQKEKEMRKESGLSVVLPELVTVKEFAERLQLPVTQVITELMKNGILANQNQNIDHETAAIMAEELGFAVQKEEGAAEDTEQEEDRSSKLEDAIARGENKQTRDPVIVVMGHVDHGKTALLDTIRKANIISTESGGITQHIGAYQTIWKDPKTSDERALTFIDTPGHEAFTVMRSRGAKVADIGILVVAADDGVKPQTEEVIQILKAAKLPFVVAINKCDKETADVQRAKTELSQRGIQPEDWGGDVPMIEISALKNTNIDRLLDVLLLVSDLQEDSMQVDATIPAVGTVIESHKDKHVGPVATVLVQAGTLKKNDPLTVNGEIYGKVRAMRDHNGQNIDMAGPSVPTQIIGFKVAPAVGDILDVAQAQGAKKIDVKEKRTKQTGAEKQVVAQSTNEDAEDGKKNTLNLVIKADVLGSLEAIIGSLEKIMHDEVGVNIVGKGLGNITENDIAKAEVGNATLIGFHVNPTPMAEENIREKEIPYKRYDVIYDLINWVKEELEKLLDTEKIITELGNMKVLAIFRTDKAAMTIGGRIEDGKAIKGALVRVKRGGEIVGTGTVGKLQTGASEIKEAPSGTECGMRFEGKDKIEKDDALEFYTEERKTRKIVFKE